MEKNFIATTKLSPHKFKKFLFYEVSFLTHKTNNTHGANFFSLNKIYKTLRDDRYVRRL